MGDNAKHQLTRISTLDEYCNENRKGTLFSIEQINEKNNNAKEKFLRWDESILHSDPYWKMPSTYISPNRLDGIYHKLSKIFEMNSKWEEDLIAGLPTYYSILGLKKDAGINEIKKAYELKKKYSIYPDDIIETAYNVMISDKIKRDYNKALTLFEKLNRSLTPSEKKELLEEHDSWIKEEKDNMMFAYFMINHSGWVDLYELGAPSFYTILNIDKNADQYRIDLGYKNQIKKNPDAKELLGEIYTVLTIPHLRWEYDSFQQLAKRYYNDIFKHKILLRKKRWSDWRNYKKLLLVHLKECEDLEKNMDKWFDIKEQNYDWSDYLPPNNKTFYDLLNLDKNKIDDMNLEKKEFEHILRNNYRDLKRTSEVNLAYSVLKNINLRKDYNWMLEYNELMKPLIDITSPSTEDELDIDEKKLIDESIKRELMEIYSRQTAGKIKSGAEKIDIPETPETKCKHDFKEIISKSKYVVYKCTLCGEINKVFK